MQCSDRCAQGLRRDIDRRCGAPDDRGTKAPDRAIRGLHPGMISKGWARKACRLSGAHERRDARHRCGPCADSDTQQPAVNPSRPKRCCGHSVGSPDRLKGQRHKDLPLTTTQTPSGRQVAPVTKGAKGAGQKYADGTQLPDDPTKGRACQASRPRTTGRLTAATQGLANTSDSENTLSSTKASLPTGRAT